MSIIWRERRLCFFKWFRLPHMTWDVDPRNQGHIRRRDVGDAGVFKSNFGCFIWHKMLIHIVKVTFADMVWETLVFFKVISVASYSWDVDQHSQGHFRRHGVRDACVFKSDFGCFIWHEMLIHIVNVTFANVVWETRVFLKWFLLLHMTWDVDQHSQGDLRKRGVRDACGFKVISVASYSMRCWTT